MRTILKMALWTFASLGCGRDEATDDLRSGSVAPDAFAIHQPQLVIADVPYESTWDLAKNAVSYDFAVATDSLCEQKTLTEADLNEPRTSILLEAGSYFLCVTAYSADRVPRNAGNNGLGFEVLASLDAVAPLSD